ncbi:MAG: hypothetical protein WCE67_03985, partial [Azonexus sp.]
QFRIGGGAAVAGNDVEGLVAAEFLAGPEQQVEQLRVDLADLALVMVAQEAVYDVQCVGNIVAADGEDNRDPFAGMGVIEFQAARVGQGGEGGSGER